MTDTLPMSHLYLLDLLRQYVAAHGYSPTRRELAHMAGISSTSAVSYQLRRLAEAGLVRVTPGVARGLVVLP